MIHIIAFVDSDGMGVPAEIGNGIWLGGTISHRLLDVAVYCGQRESPILPKREKELLKMLKRVHRQ